MLAPTRLSVYGGNDYDPQCIRSTEKAPPADDRRGRFVYRGGEPYFAFFSLMAACAAARRAIGTRKGEQET